MKNDTIISKIITVDFDGTICDFNYPNIGAPKEGVKEALRELKDMGYEIHILSCRTNPELKKYPIDRQEQVRMMEKYLTDHDIPFDVVLNEFKPLALFYIDDRAIEYRGDWKEVIRKVKND